MIRHSPLKPGRRKQPTAAERAYWGSLPDVCPVCGTTRNIVIHHILSNAPGKQGRRDNMLVVKLCAHDHNIGTYSVHLLGSEAAFKREHGVDLVALAVASRDRWIAENEPSAAA